ncbi:MAG TPA: type II toxin-antitoxin system VapC family toxin [Phycisphaerae bacterium]|nr:type II toxin-antitoxin system VapC family toxin [Phycisphaerae bacterium]
MKYLLDSNICIHYLRGKGTMLGGYLRAGLGPEIALCAPVLAELLIGARKSQHSAKHLPITEEFVRKFAILSFDEAAAKIYVDNYVALSKQGLTIDLPDLQISSIALANSLNCCDAQSQAFFRYPWFAN